jgi:uncharacterized protein YneF (UPF0154 family)
LAQHGAQRRGPRAQVTPLTFPPRLHVESVVALRVVLPQGATRGFYFTKNEASNMEALKNNAPINSQCIPGFNPEIYQNLPESGKRKLPNSNPDLRV